MPEFISGAYILDPLELPFFNKTDIVHKLFDGPGNHIGQKDGNNKGKQGHYDSQGNQIASQNFAFIS
ncbi:hypothetical protein D3C80_1965570 [compost metagenome]